MFLEEGKGNSFDLSSLIFTLLPLYPTYLQDMFFVFLFVLLMSDVYATKIYFEMAQCLINKIKCFNR